MPPPQGAASEEASASIEEQQLAEVVISSRPADVSFGFDYAAVNALPRPQRKRPAPRPRRTKPKPKTRPRRPVPKPKVIPDLPEIKIKARPLLRAAGIVLGRALFMIPLLFHSTALNAGERERMDQRILAAQKKRREEKERAERDANQRQSLSQTESTGLRSAVVGDLPTVIVKARPIRSPGPIAPGVASFAVFPVAGVRTPQLPIPLGAIDPEAPGVRASPGPRPKPAPLPSPVGAPFNAPQLNPLPQPLPLPGVDPAPAPAPEPVRAPAPKPTLPSPLIGAPREPLTGVGTLELPFPQPVPVEDLEKCCPCKKPKKKEKDRKPRQVCYKGSYRDKAIGLTKTPREQIPCQ